MTIIKKKICFFFPPLLTNTAFFLLSLKQQHTFISFKLIASEQKSTFFISHKVEVKY